MRPTWQYYHTKYGQLVTEEYERRGSSSPADRLKVRNEIARTQFFVLPMENQIALDRENAVEFDKEMDEWERDSEGRAAQQEAAMTVELQTELIFPSAVCWLCTDLAYLGLAHVSRALSSRC